MDGDKFRPHDGVCFVVTGCIYVCGGVRGRVNNRSAYEWPARFYGAVRVYSILWVVSGEPYYWLRRHVLS